MSRAQVMSLATARRVALAAQGFADPPPAGAVDRRHLRRVLRRTQLLRIDPVNVFARAHYLPLFSRPGSYPSQALDRLAFRDRELLEYWGHEASLLPVSLHPLLRRRMARARDLQEGWGGPLRVMRDQPGFVEAVLEQVRVRGPVGAGELRHGPRGPASWWGWDQTKPSLALYPTSSRPGRTLHSGRRSWCRMTSRWSAGRAWGLGS